MKGGKRCLYWDLGGMCVFHYITLSLSHKLQVAHQAMAANTVARDEDRHLSASSAPTDDEAPKQDPEKQVSGVLQDVGGVVLETLINVAKEQNWQEKFKDLFKAMLEAFEDRAVKRATEVVTSIVPQARELKSQADQEETTTTDSAQEVGTTSTNSLMAVMQKKYVRYVLCLGIAVMLLSHAYLLYLRFIGASS